MKKFDEPNRNGTTTLYVLSEQLPEDGNMNRIDEPNDNGITETRVYVLNEQDMHCHLLDNGMKVVSADDLMAFLGYDRVLGPGYAEAFAEAIAGGYGEAWGEVFDEAFNEDLLELARWLYGCEVVHTAIAFGQEMRKRPPKGDA